MNKKTQEELKMAIEALEDSLTRQDVAINACKEALEQPEQEIVRKVFDIDNFHPSVLDRIKFTSPSQWKDLSKEDIMDLFKVYPADPGFNILCDQVKMISDKLKEKNCE
jgi:hypothetical protein